MDPDFEFKLLLAFKTMCLFAMLVFGSKVLALLVAGLLEFMKMAE